MWDPGQYQRFAGERARPFADLIARVGAAAPGYVADLGCGPGNLTATLAHRWRGADVVGVDNSPEMIGAAAAQTGRAGGRLSFVLGDVRDWQPARPVDVIVSNAVLQWVPGHLGVIARWAGLLASGGWLAFQVPGNYDQPSHAILRELAQSQRWRPLLAAAELNRQTASPEQYLDLLARAGCEVDAWETTYLHVLHGEDPVLEWYRGTGLRPVLSVLAQDQAEQFQAEYARLAR
ncbi:MAG: methyltransferase domain-containing protein, partial [Actinobacteria bacterium]|nr:methyltransferase domain-containing protein [Actinomycetota bacterium]